MPALTIRRHWLVAFWIYMAISALYSIIAFMHGPLKFKYLDSGIIWALITYYCAYSSSGTRWLTLVCWSTPLYLLFNLHYNLRIAEQSSLAWVLFWALHLSLIVFWLQCIRLLRVNNARQSTATQQEQPRRTYYEYMQAKRKRPPSGKLDIESLPEAEIEDVTPKKDPL